MTNPPTHNPGINPVSAMVKASARINQQKQSDPAQPPKPFITISRQAGAGGWTLAAKLVEKLNAQHNPTPPWRAYDRELVEKICHDHNIPKSLLDSLEHSPNSWLNDFFSGLKTVGQPSDEGRAYRRVVASILELAEKGHVIIVGRGGVYITRHLPASIHIRLITPFDQRVDNLARILDVDTRTAAAEVRKRDHNRDTFHKRYWPNQALQPDAFSLTINTAKIPESAAVNMILTLVKSFTPATTKTEPEKPIFRTIIDRQTQIAT